MASVDLFLLVDAVEELTGPLFDAGSQPLVSLGAGEQCLEEPGVPIEFIAQSVDG